MNLDSVGKPFHYIQARPCSIWNVIKRSLIRLAALFYLDVVAHVLV